MSNQARNQLGTSGVAKSFLRGAQILKTISNSFQLCPTDFSRWAKSFAEKALKSVENERSFVAVVTANVANKCNSV